MVNTLTNQGNLPRCTAHAVYNAIEALLGFPPDVTPDDLWGEAKAFFGDRYVSDVTGTEMYRIMLMAQHEFPQLDFVDLKKKRGIVTRDFTDTELIDIRDGKATAAIGANLHALAIIGARKSWLGYWQLLVEDSNGSRPRWRGLWRMGKMEIAIIRKG